MLFFPSSFCLHLFLSFHLISASKGRAKATQLAAALSRRRSGCDPRPECVRFAVYRLALVQVFLRVEVSPLSILVFSACCSCWKDKMHERRGCTQEQLWSKCTGRCSAPSPCILVYRKDKRAQPGNRPKRNALSENGKQRIGNYSHRGCSRAVPLLRRLVSRLSPRSPRV
jgi:hypothetical protein